MNEPVAHTSRTILDVKPIAELLEEYIEISRRLHGEEFSVTIEEFQKLLSDSKELVSFILTDGRVVATAQASLMWTPPKLQAYINNVVTHPEYGGRGLGKAAMTVIESAVQAQWGQDGRQAINLILSNSPTKGNGGFYEKLGWTSRGPDSVSPTVVWVKTV